ncbi:hypothetical protein SAMN05443575_1641 [Jatrophihabitans endophyticus]|uniref:Glycoprotein n=1 Tax=Jatrophihabitans endophyticus TaxID=1206085 RepID=A0A1M5HUG7_9ACTN|nr:DUF6049 family protein [Jatrophihabitans endophyticus]SHG19624.1 hypothetical protein SAMN05443575_1641 [Jatrophihabitans endophyticus]
MTRPPRALRVLPALLVALTCATVPAAASSWAGPAHAQQQRAGSVQLRVVGMSPVAPARSETKRALTVTLDVTNTTGAPVSGVRITGRRGAPLQTQSALDEVVADRTPQPDGVGIAPTRPVSLDVPADGLAHRVVFRTTYGVPNDAGVCQCGDGVYPLYFAAEHVSSAGAVKQLDVAVSFLPSFLEQPKRVRVGWVWPLLDRPHRLLDETVFLDDDLAASVAGGRLDRALQVLERLDTKIPVTAVVDPELLDELEIMAETSYTVRTATGRTAGVGREAARSWLERLRMLLASTSRVRLSLTPYADPDVQSLAARQVHWTTTLPAGMARRVARALGGVDTADDVAWPAGGTVGRSALTTMAAAGVKTVVVDGSAVSPSRQGGRQVAIARLRTSAGTVAAAVASPTMTRLVEPAVTADDGSAATVPALTAEIAIRAAQAKNAAPYAVLTPSRYVDPDPARAVRAIETTSTSPFATPVGVADVGSALPARASTLRARAGSDTGGLPEANVTATEKAYADLPTVDTLLARATSARPLLAKLPRAVQRLTSSAWRTSGGAPGHAAGPQLAAALTRTVDRLVTGVHIVKPASSSYTLGSDSSSLPITVENELPYPVEIAVYVAAKDSVPGYSMVGTPRTRTIDPNTKQTLKVPSRLERSGRIPVAARLWTAKSTPLGPSVELSVRSTVFGAIGVVITVVAGGVLALALLVRFVRRLRRLRRKAAQRAARPTALAGEAP